MCASGCEERKRVREGAAASASHNLRKKGPLLAGPAAVRVGVAEATPARSQHAQPRTVTAAPPRSGATSAAELRRVGAPGAVSAHDAAVGYAPFGATGFWR